MNHVSYEAPYCAVLSSILLLPPSWVQIFSSALCVQTPSIYVPSLVQETTFHTYTR